MVIIIATALVFGAKLATKPQIQNQAEASITPEVIEVESTVGEASSLEGTMKLILKKMVDKNNQTQTYSFISSDSSSPIFTKTVGLSQSMAIPANSWSPDNKYVFVEEKNEQGEKNYLVLKASGEPFTDGQQYYDVKSLFMAKKTQYTLDKITGWASSNLLIITTLTEQSTKGPSYWFEVPSKAFLQLSR